MPAEPRPGAKVEEKHDYVVTRSNRKASKIDRPIRYPSDRKATASGAAALVKGEYGDGNISFENGTMMITGELATCVIKWCEERGKTVHSAVIRLGLQAEGENGGIVYIDGRC